VGRWPIVPFEIDLVTSRHGNVPSSISSGPVANDIRVGEAVWFHVAIVSRASDPSSDRELGWILVVISSSLLVA
jgi:hypothetical protein